MMGSGAFEEGGRLQQRHLQVDRLPLAYILLDSGHRVLDWNPAAERLFGYTKTEALGCVCFELIQSSPRDLIHAIIDRVEAGDMAAHCINQCQTKDHRLVTCDWFNTPLLEADGTFAGAISLAQDITERTRADEERARLHDEVSTSRDQLRAMSQRLFEVQEQERRHVARELHDEIGQVLTAVAISLGRARSACDPAGQRWLDESREIVTQAIHRVRELSFNLRPSMLDDLGLVAAVRWYLDQQQRRTTCHITLDTDAPELTLPTELNNACFRIVQEAVTNVLRHADARRILVRLHTAQETIRLAIRDDGIGFDPAAVRERCRGGLGLGLRGMEERAMLLDGQFDVESSPGAGTEVRVSLPLRRAVAIDRESGSV